MRRSNICGLLIFVMTMVNSEKLQYNRIPMKEALRSMQTRNRLPREPKSDFLSMPEEGAQILPFRITDEVTTEVPLDSEPQSKSEDDQLRGEENIFATSGTDVQVGTSNSVRADRIPVFEPINYQDDQLRGEQNIFATSGSVNVRVSEAIDEGTEPVTDEEPEEDDPEPTFSPSSFLNLGTNPFQAYLPQLPQQFPISIGYPQITSGNPGYTLPTQVPIGYPQTHPVQVYPVYPSGAQGIYYPQVYIEQEDDVTTSTEPEYALRSGVGTGLDTRKESGSGTGTGKKDDDKKTGGIGGLVSSDTGKLVLGLGAGYLLYNHIKNQNRPQRPQQYQQHPYYQQQPYYQPQPQYQPQQQYQPYQQYQPSQPTYSYQPSTPSFTSSTSSFSSSTPSFTSSTPSFTSSTPSFTSSTPTFTSQPSFQSGNRPYSGVGAIYGRTEARTTEEDQSPDERIIIRIPYLTNLEPPKRTKRSTITTDLSEDLKVTYYQVPHPAQNPPLPVVYQDGIETRKTGNKKTGISDTGKLVLGLGAGYLLYNHVKNQQRPQYQPQPYYQPQRPYYQPQYQYQPSRPVYNYQPGYGYGK